MWDEDDFIEAIRASAPRLYRVVARLTADLDEADDVLQESYIRAHDRLRDGGFDGRSSLETWLYRIAVHAALDALRRGRRRRAREAVAFVAEAAVDTGPRLEARAALRELAAWMGELPPEQRAVVVLKELEGYSAAEVGALLGCSEGAVEQRLVRARAFLRGRRSDAGSR